MLLITKMNWKRIIFVVILLLLSLTFLKPRNGQAQEISPGLQQSPVVRAVMFWMDRCPHCHQILDDFMPLLTRKYGDQFQLHLVELVTSQDVDQLYQIAAAINIPKAQVGVPFLIIGNQALIGSDQIPAELPGLIEQHLAAGGLDYPDVPALRALIPGTQTETEICSPSNPCADETQPDPVINTSAAPVAVVESQPSQPPESTQPTVRRSNGFLLAVGVMVGMLAAIVYAGARFILNPQGKEADRKQKWEGFITQTLALLGLGVAGYLAYVETQVVPAICGPVGDCNAVQSSSYARLFGILPIGVLGSVGYFLILAAWAWKRFRSDRLAGYASRLIFGMTVFGTLFSLYLTYLEPFVIKAVCAWCLTSAVLITLLMLISVSPALQEIEESIEE